MPGLALHPAGSRLARFTGSRSGHFPLSAAVEALAESARRAGRPGAIWIAGLCYPIFGWVVFTGLELAFSLYHALLIGQVGGDEFEWGDLLPLGTVLTDFGVRLPIRSSLGPQLFLILGIGVLMLPLMLPLFRLGAGLAGVCAPRTWERLDAGRGHPSLTQVWRAGGGVTISACGLWVLISVLLLAATLLSLGPVVAAAKLFGVARWPWASYLLLAPVFVLVALYGTVLAILYQLALHSLVQNRRGAGSALLHAWRLASHDPWTVARALCCDLLLHLVVALLVSLALALALALPAGGRWVVLATLVPLRGFAGVARAGYWARSYRALGGLTPDDGVPGLEPGLARSV